MRPSQFPYLAVDGWPFIGVVVTLGIFALSFESAYQWHFIAVTAVVLALLVLMFRDPERDIPSLPLAIVAPVDGTVTDVSPTDRAHLGGEAIRVEIKLNRLGAYAARSPTEGKVVSLNARLSPGSRLHGEGGLWVRTHEDDDVVLMFRGPKFARPVAFIHYGERIGQGQRCAFTRLATHAEVYLPINSRIEIAAGDRVKAGSDIIATLVHK
ncbi:MAG: phosphatidylserine decarboxylase [Gammaproteobacteria bacterium]